MDACVSCEREFTASDRVRGVQFGKVKDWVHTWAQTKRYEQCKTDSPHVHDGCWRVPEGLKDA